MQANLKKRLEIENMGLQGRMKQIKKNKTMNLVNRRLEIGWKDSKIKIEKLLRLIWTWFNVRMVNTLEYKENIKSRLY